jgi:hypothetical protein
MQLAFMFVVVTIDDALLVSFGVLVICVQGSKSFYGVMRRCESERKCRSGLGLRIVSAFQLRRVE